MTKVPPKPSPTAEQLAIYDAVKNTTESIFVTAYAGTGKTTTLEELAPLLRGPVLALAFNQDIAKELKLRLPKHFHVKTLNGLGHSALQQALRRFPELDPQKLSKLLKVYCSGFSKEEWSSTREAVRLAMQAGIVPESFKHTRGLLPDTPEGWEEALGYAPEDKVLHAARSALTRNIELVFAKESVISFDDQIYMPLMFGGAWPKYPTVLCDETQDFSPMNVLQLSKVATGRIIAVGDQRQCHPPGTMISLEGGGLKPIEQVKIGDRVISYNRKVGFTGTINQGSTITDARQFWFDGELVSIKMNNIPNEYQCTPEHKCLVRWPQTKDYCLYLMQKGNQYRIGIAKTFYTKPIINFGPAMRARQENADAVWVLRSGLTKEEAQIEEKIVWTTFGLPDLIFNSSGKASSSQYHLDSVWASLGDNSRRAQACLRHFARDIRFPIWQKGQHTHIGRKSFITQACNLVSGMQMLPYFNQASKSEWTEVNITSQRYTGPVYGLTVSSNGYQQNLYVAGGIVTHNSIYVFRGASPVSIQTVKALRETWIELPLTVTFRCPKVVVARASRHAPGFAAHDTAPDGVLGDFRGRPWAWSNVMGITRPGAPVAVLCRNNAPLIALALKLLRQHQSITILGNDIAKGLKKLANTILPRIKPQEEGLKLVKEWKEQEIAKLTENSEEEKIAGISDRADCLIALLETMPDSSGLSALLDKLFSKTSAPITLATGHKAKGLEWDTVVHLDPWRVPSKRAINAGGHELEQEYNLRYVLETRTKHTLVLADLKDFVT